MQRKEMSNGNKQGVEKAAFKASPYFMSYVFKAVYKDLCIKSSSSPNCANFYFLVTDHMSFFLMASAM